MKRLAAAAAMALLLAACSSSSKSDSPTIEAPNTSAPTTSAATAPATSKWTTYHHDAARTGVADDQATIGQVRKSWESPPLDSDIYSQPLVVDGHVLVATEANSVYALDVTTGAQVWRAQLGAPVKGSSLPCGNIDPSGITGTPVVDPGSNTLYTAAFLAAGTHHELFALDLTSGTTRWHRPVESPGLSGRVEQERGALTIANGRVHIPFGGLFGDCGGYKGSVVSSALDGQGPLTSYLVATRREAGIWHPGGPAVDSNGDLFVSTGNSESNGAFDYGNAVVRLNAQLQAVDYFAPTNWLRLNQSDTDLGSIGPALVGANRVLAAGKQGIAYLLDRAHLGNIGGSITQIQACNGGAFGTAAVRGTTVFVPCTDGLVALGTDADKLTQKWRRPGSAGPPIVAGGLVWDLDSNGTLVALDPTSGQQRFAAHVDDPASRFVSLSAASGRVFVAPKNTVTAFALR